MESHSARKKHRGGRNRFLLCFKPVTTGDSFRPRKLKGNTDPVLTYVAAPKRESSVLPTTLPPALTDCKGKNGGNHRRKGDDCSVWHALKLALNETSLARKITKTKALKYRFSRTSSKLREEDDEISDPEFKSLSGQVVSSVDNDSSRQTNSNASSSFRCSSAFTSPSLSSSTSSSSSSTRTLTSGSSSEIFRFGWLPRNNGIVVTKQKRDGVEGIIKGKGSATALCLLFVSLLVLIFWGKFFAILCTSIWFFLVPRRLSQCNQPFQGENEFDSVEYKKKIVMEGLLERSHSRVSMASMVK